MGTGVRNHIFAQINRNKQRVLIDTGATKSCISEQLFNKIRSSLNKRSPLTADEPSHLVTADKNKPLAIIGTADLNVKINGYIIVQKFYVIQDLSHPCILGMDFLNDNRGLIRVADRVLDLHDGLIVVPLISRET